MPDDLVLICFNYEDVYINHIRLLRVETRPIGNEDRSRLFRRILISNLPLLG